MTYIIVNLSDDALAWSNANGWTEDTFDTFTQGERDTLDLPMGGAWVQVPWNIA